MDWEVLLPSILSAVLAVIGFFAKIKFNKVKKLMVEFAEAFVVTSSAIEDDEVTMEEAIEMVAEWRDVINAACDITRAGKVMPAPKYDFVYKDGKMKKRKMVVVASQIKAVRYKAGKVLRRK